MRMRVHTGMTAVSALMVVSVAINMAFMQSSRRGVGHDATASSLLGRDIAETGSTTNTTGEMSSASLRLDRATQVRPSPRGQATAASPALLNAAPSTVATTSSTADLLDKTAPPAAAALAGTSEPDTVRGIQRELNARGYEAGTADGVMGLVTRAAILAYEQDYGLSVLTATASSDLLQQIVLGSAATAATRTASPKTTDKADAVVQAVKQSLSTHGYQPGKIDGALTPQLARAIREFELDQKLPESGRISGPLVSRLMRLQVKPTKPAVTSSTRR